MRNRAVLAGLVAAAALSAGLWAAVEVRRERGPATRASAAARDTQAHADAPLFVPSDVARLAATGRPQLVEFYHPG